MAFIFGCALGLACGVLWGIYDCKRTFHIPAHAKPSEGCWYPDVYVEELQERAYSPYVEVDDDGIVNP